MILVVKTIDARYSKFLSLPTKANYSQTSSLAQTKKSKILNTVLKPKITYTYYTTMFSKPNIKKKLNKILNKLTKEICNTTKSTTNILTHLKNEDLFMIIY